MDAYKINPNQEQKGQILQRTELNGLQWLENMINLDRLNVVQADKGGAILLANPELLKKTDKKNSKIKIYIWNCHMTPLMNYMKNCI